MLTQYDELKAANGSYGFNGGASGGYDENSMNYSGGYYDDYNMTNRSPSIVMRSPSMNEYNDYTNGSGNRGDNINKRKSRSSAVRDKDEFDDDRMIGSGLLDIPDHLGSEMGDAGRLSQISDGKLIYV